MPRDHVSIQQHALRRERDKSKDSRERDRSLEMKESLLSQALEGGPTLTIPTQVDFHSFHSHQPSIIYWIFISLPLMRTPSTPAFGFAIASSPKHRRGFQQQRHRRFRCRWWTNGRVKRFDGSLENALVCQLLPWSSESTRASARPIRHARQLWWVSLQLFPKLFNFLFAFINKLNKKGKKRISFFHSTQ